MTERRTDTIQLFTDELAVDMRRAEAELRRVTKTSGLYSYVQRTLRIGYDRANLVVEALEAAGILSKPDDNGDRQLR